MRRFNRISSLVLLTWYKYASELVPAPPYTRGLIGGERGVLRFVFLAANYSNTPVQLGATVCCFSA